MKILAVIPARGGSKRIPRKNIRKFLGKPAIQYSIDVALESCLFDKVLVSTDDVEIEATAQDLGALSLGLRNQNLADDNSPTAPVVAYEINRYENQFTAVDLVCCIYPCAPTIEIQDLKNGLKLLRQGHLFAYPVTEYPHPIQRAMRMRNNGRMEFLMPHNELVRTQDLEKTFHDAGMFYWGSRDAWVNKYHMHTDGVGFKIPNWRVIDIDEEDDWIKAELLVKSVR